MSKLFVELTQEQETFVSGGWGISLDIGKKIEDKRSQKFGNVSALTGDATAHSSGSATSGSNNIGVQR